MLKMHHIKSKRLLSKLVLALDMFYDGLSSQDIAQHLEHTYNNPVDESTVYRWVMSYTEKAINALGKLRPKVSDTWVVDETVIKVGGE